MPVAQDKKINNKVKIKIPDFEHGVIWEDLIGGHKIGCLDVSKKEDVEKLMQEEKAILAVQDPPYFVFRKSPNGNF